jgi:small subunit ribosomal protein S19
MAEEKIFKYRGKTLEELKSLNLEELMELFPSSIRRKLKRGFSHQEQIVLDKLKAGKKNIKTHARDMIVLPEMVGKKIQIYSGKEFVSVTIIEEMIGLRFGELVPTRPVAKHSGGGAKKTSIRK